RHERERAATTKARPTGDVCALEPHLSRAHGRAHVARRDGPGAAWGGVAHEGQRSDSSNAHLRFLGLSGPLGPSPPRAVERRAFRRTLDRLSRVASFHSRGSEPLSRSAALTLARRIPPMLPPFIIEQIRKREEQERKQYEQPQLEIPAVN